MVSLVQSFDEFYGLVDNFLDESDFTGSSSDDGLNDVLSLMLVLLNDFYNDYKYVTTVEVVGDDFKNDLERLRLRLIDAIDNGLNDYISVLKRRYDSEYELGEYDVYEFDDFRDCMHSMIDTMIYQLYYDVVNKARYYDVMMVQFIKDFNMNSNFRRLVNRFKEGFDNNFKAVMSSVERTYLEYVYGEDALFYWVPSGRNTCEWCYMLADMSPQPLSAFPKDHPNGACVLSPLNPIL